MRLAPGFNRLREKCEKVLQTRTTKTPPGANQTKDRPALSCFQVGRGHRGFTRNL